MPGTVIVTDSTADLSPELVRANHLRVVPLLVHFGATSFQDGVDLDTPRLFQLVAENKRLPQTSSPSPETFRATFAEATADGSNAIFIGISSRLSATFQNATIAAGMLPHNRVRIFDSANLSTGIGLLALHACDLVREGKTVDEVIAALEQARPQIRTSFMVDTLEYVHMGGRVSGVQALVGSLLRIRPVISVVDGALVVTAKLRGHRQKGLDWMLEGFADDVKQGRVRPNRIFITHTGVHDDALRMASEVRRIMPDVQEVLETDAGSVIGSHCGPGTIGILYMLK